MYKDYLVIIALSHIKRVDGQCYVTQLLRSILINLFCFSLFSSLEFVNIMLFFFAFSHSLIWEFSFFSFFNFYTFSSSFCFFNSFFRSVGAFCTLCICTDNHLYHDYFSCIICNRSLKHYYSIAFRSFYHD